MILRDVLHRIEQRLSETNLPAATASTKAGLSRDAIRNIRRAASEPGRKGVSTNTIAKLAVALETTPEWLMRGIETDRGQEGLIVQFAPLLSWVAAGTLIDPFAGDVTSPQIVDAPQIPLIGLPPSDYIALRVVGDSMDRIAPENSIVIADRNDIDPKSKQFYIVLFESGETTFKRYYDAPDRLEPYSTNPTHETIFPTMEWSAVGRVKRVIYDL